MGWVLWFAYIVAGVLYALGFAEYAAASAGELWQLANGSAPAWMTGRRMVVALAVGATAIYTIDVIRKTSGGGQYATIGKVIVFAVLIAGGFWALVRSDGHALSTHFKPFTPFGVGGLLQAMGFTFIALQGFDLIAAIAGEVKEPARVIPRAMLLSLGLALVIYIPLLIIVPSVGTVAGESIVTASEKNPETVMALAVKNYMGPVGYWLVMVAAVLSTLSALQANLLAASRVALSMARDRTLPRVLAQSHSERRTPVMAIYTSALALVAILFMVPDLAAAGAAASLIFLISFALAHWTAILARRRAKGKAMPFRTPWFPLVPVVGGLACGALAIFQGFAVPAAGGITAVWLGLGVLLYFSLFASRAETVDAFAQAQNPELTRLRGKSPLVLVPVANPESAAAMVEIASALSPPEVGRVLLLSVMRKPDKIEPGQVPEALLRSQRVLEQALTTAFSTGHLPEALMTIAPQPWPEIVRVARTRECEGLLLGLSKLDEPTASGPLEELLNEVECDVAVLRAPVGWKLESPTRILAPIGGRGGQDELRARLIGSLCREHRAEVTFLRILPESTPDDEVEEAERALKRMAEDETPGEPRALVVRSGDVVKAVQEAARESECDLLVLGLQRHGGRKLFGEVALRIAREVPCATIMLSRKR